MWGGVGRRPAGRGGPGIVHQRSTQQASKRQSTGVPLPACSTPGKTGWLQTRLPSGLSCPRAPAGRGCWRAASARGSRVAARQRGLPPAPWGWVPRLEARRAACWQTWLAAARASPAGVCLGPRRRRWRRGGSWQLRAGHARPTSPMLLVIASESEQAGGGGGWGADGWVPTVSRQRLQVAHRDMSAQQCVCWHAGNACSWGRARAWSCAARVAGWRERWMPQTHAASSAK